ncbi:MAG: hypothetical protein CUN55_16290, partial [Phototrophicales bacterium]
MPLGLYIKSTPRYNVTTGPLDGYDASKYVAYSMNRRLVGSYTGPLFRVRRSSDNAEMDIPQAGTIVDMGTFNSFVGSDTAYVTKWYDQGGRIFDMAQSVASAQPIIVTVGGFLLQQSDGVDDQLISAQVLNETFNYFQAVYLNNRIGTASHTLIYSTGNHGAAGNAEAREHMSNLHWATSEDDANNMLQILSSAPLWNEHHIRGDWADVSTKTMSWYRDGVQQASQQASTYNNAILKGEVQVHNNNTYKGVGNLGEIVLY